MSTAGKTPRILSAPIVALAVAALALTGCSAAEDAPPASSGGGQTTAQTVTDDSTPDGDDPCSVEPGEDRMARDVVIDDQLVVKNLADMRDTGPRDGANGDVTLNDDGGLASYTVAPGDGMDGIADRFCAYPIWIEALNSVRRNSWLSGSNTGTALYAGDVLNLDPYTITSVGTENGEVEKNTPDFALPPQS